MQLPVQSFSSVCAKATLATTNVSANKAVPVAVTMLAPKSNRFFFIAFSFRYQSYDDCESYNDARRKTPPPHIETGAIVPPVLLLSSEKMLQRVTSFLDVL
jgi:hypothetical protein